MTPKSKQVMDIMASAGMTADQSNEHLRKWSERGWADAVKHGNYDRSRTHLNFEVGPDGITPIDQSRPIPKRIKESMAARGIADPNEKKKALGKEPNRRTVVNIIFGGSRETMNRLAFGDQQLNLEHGADNSGLQRMADIEEWAKDVYRFACDKWGWENVVAFVVHLDETNVHAHCTVLPVTSSNKLSFKKVFAGENKFEYQQRMRQLHTDFAAVCKRWRLDRGDDIRETGAKHRTTAQYWAALRRACEELEIELSIRKRSIAELNEELAKATRRQKGLATMLRNLEQKEQNLLEEIADLESRLAEGNQDAEQLRSLLTHLQAKLESTRDDVADKQRKLRIADRQLESVLDQIESATAEFEEVKAEAKEAAREHGEQMRMKISDSVFGKIVKELRIMLRTLTPGQRANMDLDFLETLANHPMELMKTAMFLMAGYVDGAIQFAQSSGGGGGTTSDLRWGRDPNEDDRHFAHRCLTQAHKLLKPAQQTYNRGRR